MSLPFFLYSIPRNLSYNSSIQSLANTGEGAAERIVFQVWKISRISCHFPLDEDQAPVMVIFGLHDSHQDIFKLDTCNVL